MPWLSCHSHHPQLIPYYYPLPSLPPYLYSPTVVFSYPSSPLCSRQERLPRQWRNTCHPILPTTYPGIPTIVFNQTQHEQFIPPPSIVQTFFSSTHTCNLLLPLDRDMTYIEHRFLAVPHRLVLLPACHPPQFCPCGGGLSHCRQATGNGGVSVVLFCYLHFCATPLFAFVGSTCSLLLHSTTTQTFTR